jgi:hypothetical protein
MIWQEPHDGRSGKSHPSCHGVAQRAATIAGVQGPAIEGPAIEGPAIEALSGAADWELYEVAKAKRTG